MFKIAFGCIALLLLTSCGSPVRTSPAVLSDLAPTGKLRIGINYANPVLATKDPTSGELRGVTVDLARELARRLDVPVELIGYATAGSMVGALKANGWDVAFLAVDPSRAAEISFTAPYLEIDGTYLVPAGSALQSASDVDRTGIRIAVAAKSAYDLFLSRSLKNAQLVRASSPEAAFGMLVAGKAEAMAWIRPGHVAIAHKLPGSRVLSGRFMTIEQAVGISKGRDAGANYLREFIEDAKASGLVAEAIERAGVRGASVAQAQPR